jgi:hypothetical protein
VPGRVPRRALRRRHRSARCFINPEGRRLTRIYTLLDETSTTPVLLGIVAETRFAPIQVQGGAIPGFAGLGLAFEVETIAETLDLF